MKAGTENRRQMIMAGVLGVLALGACIYIYEELYGGGTSAPDSPAPAAAASAPAAPQGDGAAAGPRTTSASGTAAKTIGTTSAALDPTLHMEAMLVSEAVEYSGIGRNIFSTNSAPPPLVIQKPIAPARAQASAPPPPPLPCPPNCPPPPPPPPIDLKFFGVETASNGTKQALLLHGDSVQLATVGEVVLRRYRVIAIDAKSILVEDMQNNNRQTLPLLAN